MQIRSGLHANSEPVLGRQYVDQVLFTYSKVDKAIQMWIPYRILRSGSRYWTERLKYFNAVVSCWFRTSHLVSQMGCNWMREQSPSQKTLFLDTTARRLLALNHARPGYGLGLVGPWDVPVLRAESILALPWCADFLYTGLWLPVAGG